MRLFIIVNVRSILNINCHATRKRINFKVSHNRSQFKIYFLKFLACKLQQANEIFMDFLRYFFTLLKRKNRSSLSFLRVHVICSLRYGYRHICLFSSYTYCVMATIFQFFVQTELLLYVASRMLFISSKHSVYFFYLNDLKF